jgi:hypothetical protein
MCVCVCVCFRKQHKTHTQRTFKKHFFFRKEQSQMDVTKELALRQGTQEEAQVNDKRARIYVFVCVCVCACVVVDDLDDETFVS